MATPLDALLSFVVALIISSIIIYAITALFGEKKGFLTAVLAALAGTVIYTIVYLFLGHGLLTSFIAGIFWLLALHVLYNIGWILSLITAVVIWIVASIVGLLLPTLGGPV